MPVTTSLPGYRWFDFLKNVAARTGIYSGVFLSIVFAGWIVIANVASFLQPVAVGRDIVAGVLLLFFACLPLLRFYRSPAQLLLSGLIAWTLLTVTYRILGFFFDFLEGYDSTFHVFVLGAVCYLLFATLSWIGTIIWRVRMADNSHPRH